MTQSPHIVVRWVSCFYSPVSVELIPADQEAKLPELLYKSHIQPGTLLVPDPDPEAGTRWTEPRREALIEEALRLSRHIQKQLCVVFGAEDSVYLAPSGTRNHLSAPPSGGIDALTGRPHPSPPKKSEGRTGENGGGRKAPAPKAKPVTFHYSDHHSGRVLGLGEPSGLVDCEAEAFSFLARLSIRVSGVHFVEGECPGNDLTYVKVDDERAVEGLRKALAAVGYAMTIE